MPFKPNIRFSLKRLFLIWTLGILCFAWAGAKVNRYRHERNVADRLNALGIHTVSGSAANIVEEPLIVAGVGKIPSATIAIYPDEAPQTWISTKWKQFNSSVIHLEAENVPVSGVVLHDISAFSDLLSLQLIDSHIEADAFDVFIPSSTLRWVSLSGSDLKNVPPQFLATLSQLEWLDLSECNLQDLWMEAFPPLEKLRVLDLSANPDLTDVGLRHLMNLHNLRIARLNDTALSDQGRDKLLTHKALERIELIRTHVTWQSDQSIARRSSGRIKCVWQIGSMRQVGEGEQQ